MKTTFKETVVLSEARNPDLTYKEKVVKNKIDRVTVELAGNPSGVMSRLTSRYDRLDKAIKTMTVKRNEMNEQIKDTVTDLFNSEDIVLTRVVETVSFTLTLSKLVKSAEQNPKIVVDYESIAKDLAKLIPEELQAQVEAITKMYTEVSIAADKSPALRIKNKNEEKLDEGILDSIKGLANKVVKWAKGMASWAVGYDKKLDSLKKRASLK
jgi:hypothetical protein